MAAEKLKDSLLIGELGLDGSVKPVKGRTGPGIGCQENGISPMLFTSTNMAEGALVEGYNHRYKVASSFLQEVVSQEDFESWIEKMPVTINNRTFKSEYPFDFREICGQNVLRRAAEVAAAGRHGL